MTINTKEGSKPLCPFSDSCNLPQLEMLCSFPECKVCPEYQNKVENIQRKQ